MNLDVGLAYKHAEGNTEYEILALCKIKDEKTGEWVDGVVYAPATCEKGGREIYVRTKGNFTSRFTEVRS